MISEDDFEAVSDAFTNVPPGTKLSGIEVHDLLEWMRGAQNKPDWITSRTVFTIGV